MNRFLSIVLILLSVGAAGLYIETANDSRKYAMRGTRATSMAPAGKAGAYCVDCLDLVRCRRWIAPRLCAHLGRLAEKNLYVGNLLFVLYELDELSCDSLRLGDILHFL